MNNKVPTAQTDPGQATEFYPAALPAEQEPAKTPEQQLERLQIARNHAQRAANAAHAVGLGGLAALGAAVFTTPSQAFAPATILSKLSAAVLPVAGTVMGASELMGNIGDRVTKRIDGEIAELQTLASKNITAFKP